MKCPSCGKETRSKIRDYEYVESGLKDVVLKSIKVHECKSCGEVLPEIPNVKQVHKGIAEYLLRKPVALTGEELRFLRKAMGKSAKDLAESLNVSPVTISRWENNKESIGPQSDRLLRMTFVLDPIVVLSRSAHALLELSRAILQRKLSDTKKIKSQRIVIQPLRSQREDLNASE